MRHIYRINREATKKIGADFCVIPEDKESLGYGRNLGNKVAVLENNYLNIGEYTYRQLRKRVSQAKELNSLSGLELKEMQRLEKILEESDKTRKHKILMS